MELRPYGLEFTSCIDAATALNTCHRIWYPLIIQAIWLPDMDGLEFCRRVRTLSHEKRSKILIISGYMMAQEAREAGADEFLSKPVNSAQFINRVLALLQIGGDAL
jgi:DNA-binding response OmpR family regulator